MHLELIPKQYDKTWFLRTRRKKMCSLIKIRVRPRDEDEAKGTSALAQYHVSVCFPMLSVSN